MKVLTGFIIGAATGVAVSAVVMNQIQHNQKTIIEEMNKKSSIKEEEPPIVATTPPSTEEPIEKPIEAETPKKEFPVFKVILNNIEVTCHEGIDYDIIESTNSFSIFIKVKPRIKSKFDLMLKRHLDLNIDDSIDFIDMVHVTDWAKNTKSVPVCKIINASAQISKPSEIVIVDTNQTNAYIKEYLGIGKKGTSLTTLKFALILSKLDEESAFNVFCEYLTEEDKESFMKDVIAAQIGDILY
jgi:hypothetical protein